MFFYSIEHKVTTNRTNNLGKFDNNKKTQKDIKHTPYEKHCNEEKNTKNTFDHFRPHNEPQLSFLRFSVKS